MLRSIWKKTNDKIILIKIAKKLRLTLLKKDDIIYA